MDQQTGSPGCQVGPLSEVNTGQTQTFNHELCCILFGPFRSHMPPLFDVYGCTEGAIKVPEIAIWMLTANLPESDVVFADSRQKWDKDILRHLSFPLQSPKAHERWNVKMALFPTTCPLYGINFVLSFEALNLPLAVKGWNGERTWMQSTNRKSWEA